MGRAICRGLADVAAALVINVRSADRLSAAKDELVTIGARVLAVSGDVSQPQTVDWLFDRVAIEFGQLHLLVNNAGAADGGPIDELPLESWGWVINTNLRGPFLCTQRAMQLVKPQRGGALSTSDRFPHSVSDRGQRLVRPLNSG